MLQTKSISLDQVKRFIRLSHCVINNAGFTVNLNTDEFPRKGYAVAQNGYTETVNGFDKLTDTDIAALIAAYVRSHPLLYVGKTNGQIYLGTWVSDNVLHLECVKVFRTAESAIFDGVHNKQHSIYDLKNNKIIELKYF